MAKTPIVAIIGRANVGKSSVFNRFLNKREAIVSEVPGTTRDTISGLVSTSQGNFWLVDTAGLKNPEDEFEMSIQEQITQAADTADLLLVVVDGKAGISDEDRRVAKMALKSQKPTMLLINKVDSPKVEPDQFERLGIRESYKISAVHNIGFDDLEEKIYHHIPISHEQPDDILRISLVGRPNVGKSSIFNKLLSKQEAIVADFAGTTRDINRKRIKFHDRTFELIDTAGIRRSGKIKRGIEKFSVLRALRAIEEADVCIMVIDANEYLTHLDQKISGMVKDAGKGLILVINKWDEVEKDPYTRDAIAEEISREYPFVPWAPLVFTSAITGKNIAKLYEIALDIISNRTVKLQTKDLNNWLHKATSFHPPAGLKNTHPKIKYVTQTDTNPPTFTFFGSQMKFLHWSYKRYLERGIREELFNYLGTPIKLKFVNKNKDKDKE